MLHSIFLICVMEKIFWIFLSSFYFFFYLICYSCNYFICIYKYNFLLFFNFLFSYVLTCMLFWGFNSTSSSKTFDCYCLVLIESLKMRVVYLRIMCFSKKIDNSLCILSLLKKIDFQHAFLTRSLHCSFLKH